MRSLRFQTWIALFLAGAVFLLPFRCLSVLGRAPGSDLSLKRLALRSANRLRSTGLVTPRLTRDQWGMDGGRKKPAGLIASHPSLTSDPRPPRRRLVPPPLGMTLALFPLRC